jgi:cytochrome c oxidase subunit 2
LSLLTRLGLAPEQASTMAARVDHFYLFMIAVSAFFAVLIAVTIVAFTIRYRRTERHVTGAKVEGSLLLESIWTAVPFAIAMCMFAWSASLYLAFARPPDDAIEIFVVGKQWMWKIQHMEGRREINELHVPVGQPVKLTMTSEDVIHSFYIPAFRVKADTVPGRYTTLWFQATKPGSYHLFCAEYCGTEHSGMIGTVVAMEPSDYQQWLSAEAPQIRAASPGGQPGKPQSLATLGEAVFKRQACDTCHRVDPSLPRGNGPTLTGVYGSIVTLSGGTKVKANEGYLRESIMNPMAKIVDGYPPLMPTFQGRLTEDEVLQLIAYVKSLGNEDANRAGNGPANGPAVADDLGS